MSACQFDTVSSIKWGIIWFTKGLGLDKSELHLHLIKKPKGSQCYLWGTDINTGPLDQTCCYLLNPETPFTAHCTTQARGSKCLDSARRSCIWMNILQHPCLTGKDRACLGSSSILTSTNSPDLKGHPCLWIPVTKHRCFQSNNGRPEFIDSQLQGWAQLDIWHILLFINCFSTSACLEVSAIGGPDPLKRGHDN